MSTAVELKGAKFGRLTVLKKGSNAPTTGKTRWMCRCNCGKIKVILTASLRNGTTTSCGCWQRESAVERATKHESCNTRAYACWLNMKQRCLNPKATGYERYGGAGIKLCKRWMDFANFFADMGECPENFTIERKKSKGNYTKSNCIWASRKTQSTNRPSFVHHVKWKGKVWTMTDLAHAHGLSFSTLKRRKNLGWPLKRALTTPVRQISGVHF